MSDRVLESGYLGSELGSIRSVDRSQPRKSLLRVVNSVSITVKKAELEQGVSIAGPDVDGFFVGSLRSIQFLLLTKRVTQIEEIIRFDRSRIF